MGVLILATVMIVLLPPVLVVGAHFDLWYRRYHERKMRELEVKNNKRWAWLGGEGC